MSENVQPEQSPSVNANEGIPEQVQSSEKSSYRATGGRNSGGSFRHGNSFRDSGASTSKDFVGATPKIGGILGLRTKNVTKKVSYDLFCKKMGTYIMNKFKNGDAVVEVTKDHTFDVIGNFERENKPSELTVEEKRVQWMLRSTGKRSRNTSKT